MKEHFLADAVVYQKLLAIYLKSFSLFHNFFLMETSNRFLNQRRDVDIKQ